MPIVNQSDSCQFAPLIYSAYCCIHHAHQIVNPGRVEGDSRFRIMAGLYAADRAWRHLMDVFLHPSSAEDNQQIRGLAQGLLHSLKTPVNVPRQTDLDALHAVLDTTFSLNYAQTHPVDLAWAGTVVERVQRSFARIEASVFGRVIPE